EWIQAASFRQLVHLCFDGDCNLWCAETAHRARSDIVRMDRVEINRRIRDNIGSTDKCSQRLRRNRAPRCVCPRIADDPCLDRSELAIAIRSFSIMDDPSMPLGMNPQGFCAGQDHLDWASRDQRAETDDCLYGNVALAAKCPAHGQVDHIDLLD